MNHRMQEGLYYVVAPGETCIDAAGHEYPIDRPTQLQGHDAAPAIDPLPHPTLTPQALREIEAAQAWLIPQAVEHGLCLLVDCTGAVAGEVHFTDDDPHTYTIDMPTLIREALDVGAVGIYSVHNHPSGEARESQQDQTQRAALQHHLAREGLALVGYAVVPGQPAALTEAQREPMVFSDWHRRQRELESQPQWFKQIMARRMR